MKLKKATERLTRYLKLRKPEPMDNFNEAVQLGIKALERVKWHKQQHLNGYYELLPGETKD